MSTESITSSDVVFFFGAGASAPFNIPTMKKLVIDFETELEEGASSEKRIYQEIKNALVDRLERPVDIEAIFTVIDGIIDYSTERLGFLSLYSAPELNVPDKSKTLTCRSLRMTFKKFISAECCIPTDSFSLIGEVYHDFLIDSRLN